MFDGAATDLLKVNPSQRASNKRPLKPAKKKSRPSWNGIATDPSVMMVLV
jgi:hypothetical protein